MITNCCAVFCLNIKPDFQRTRPSFEGLGLSSDDLLKHGSHALLGAIRTDDEAFLCKACQKSNLGIHASAVLDMYRFTQSKEPLYFKNKYKR